MTSIYVHESDISIENHAARIRASGILARTTHLHNLFEYLYRCYTKNRTPREFEIVIEGIGEENKFEVSQEMIVSVYVQELRRKLDEYYEKYDKDMPIRLQIAAGEYRLALEARAESSTQSIFKEGTHQAEPGKTAGARNINIALLCTVIILLNIIFLLLSQDKHSRSENQLLRESQLWKPVLVDERPALIAQDFDFYGYPRSRL